MKAGRYANMMQLLVIREKLRKFYGRYSGFIIPIEKFVLGMASFWLINANIGFMSKLKNPLIPIVMGLIASMIPCGATAFLAGCFLAVHVSRVSMEVAILIVVFMLVIMMLYYGFKPKDGYLLLLTPLMFYMRIPYMVPLLVGLSGSLVSVIPVCSGVVVYYIMSYMKQNAGVLTGNSMAEMAGRFMVVAKNILTNELMWVMIAAFAASILVVYVVRNLAVDYAWTIAVIAGVITQLVVIFIGDFNFNLPVSVGGMVIGLLVSVVLVLIYEFFTFAVDYSRTEYLQYQDDDYYYYVKAVPKISVSTPDVKVHRISSRKTTESNRIK